ncbi:MAG: restriction endonuclease subunit S [Sphingobacteriaceae bacterium]|nr:restriction endonuclease subunit S [Sphingobacteriaceae bacterium]
MKLVELNKIFNVHYGNQFDLYRLETNELSDINFVSRSSQNLGVVSKVSMFNEVEPFSAGLITVTLGGTYLLSSFVQQDPFYTAQNIKVLTPIKPMSFSEKIFYCNAISANRFRYTSHGREANVTLNTLLIPEEVPSEFLDVDVEQISNLIVSEKSLNNATYELDAENWQYFSLEKLFDIQGTKTTTVLELEAIGAGIFPYVTTQASNNGVENFYNFSTEAGNVLTFDSAVLGYTSFQELPFSASDHVEKLIPKFEMNQYSALFLVTILNLEQYRYNYGRKCSQTRIRKIQIKLPSKNNEPDFEFMCDYIKSLSYSGSLKN